MSDDRFEDPKFDSYQTELIGRGFVPVADFVHDSNGHLVYTRKLITQVNHEGKNFIITVEKRDSERQPYKYSEHSFEDGRYCTSEYNGDEKLMRMYNRFFRT